MCVWRAPVFAYLNLFTCLSFPPFLPILSLLSSLILSLLLFPSLSQALYQPSSIYHHLHTSVSDVINSSFLAVFSFPFSQWNGGSWFSAGHRDQELEEQINPPWVASPRLVSCGSASLSSLSVGAGSTAVGKARGLFSLAPLELDTGIHP